MKQNFLSDPKDPNISSFYGIGEGSKVREKANADMVEHNNKVTDQLVAYFTDQQNKQPAPTTSQNTTTDPQQTKAIIIAIVVIVVVLGGAYLYMRK